MAQCSSSFISVPSLLAHHLSWTTAGKQPGLLARERMTGDHLLLQTQLCLLSHLIQGSRYSRRKRSGGWSTHSLGQLSADHGCLHPTTPPDTLTLVDFSSASFPVWVSAPPSMWSDSSVHDVHSTHCFPPAYLHARDASASVRMLPPCLLLPKRPRSGHC